MNPTACQDELARVRAENERLQALVEAEWRKDLDFAKDAELWRKHSPALLKAANAVENDSDWFGCEWMPAVRRAVQAAMARESDGA